MPGRRRTGHGVHWACSIYNGLDLVLSGHCSLWRGAPRLALAFSRSLLSRRRRTAGLSEVRVVAPAPRTVITTVQAALRLIPIRRLASHDFLPIERFSIDPTSTFP